MAKSEMKNVLTTRQVAAQLRISPSLVTRYWRWGRLSGQRVGCQILFDIAEVKRFAKLPRKRGCPGKGKS